MSDHATPPTAPPSGASRRGLIGGALAAGLLLLLLVGGSIATTSCMRRFHGHHTPEALQDRVEFAADWILHRVDATDAQKTEVQAILDRAVEDLMDLRLDHRALHEAAVTELTKPQIERDALERLRLEQMQAIDQGSRRIVEALADLAEVLTPEQRVELVELAERFHSRRWHH